MHLCSSQELLQSKPEQEEKLLSILVNKLGDVEKKVSRQLYSLSSAAKY